jgi:GTPase SAR1 family protein
LRTLENRGTVISVAFSADARLLAAKLSTKVRLWRCDSWEPVGELDDTSSHKYFGYNRFTSSSNGSNVFITLKDSRHLCIWDIDAAPLLSAASSKAVHYANAKIVLVGDTGVGKSGLGLVLSGQPFAPTDSTHGRQVWVFEQNEIQLIGDSKERRETFLWDLAGQPGYRLIHQLHLSEVAIALVVFDARSEVDPFAGVRHWDKALRQAQRVLGGGGVPARTFLVAARVDRGALAVSHGRIQKAVDDMGFNGFYETSAREGWGIPELRAAISSAIDWDLLPKVSSTEFFESIKSFILGEKAIGRILSTKSDLYRSFLNTDKVNQRSDSKLQFEICLGRVESRGLIRRMSFGDLTLLQPELLDAYASALVNAAKEEPDGLGSILEDDAFEGRFRMSQSERVQERDTEKLLLIATVEELLRRDIVIREAVEDGVYLVFPSQLTREGIGLADPEGKEVTFHFSGAIVSIYATLAVRLTHSGIFVKKDLWRHAATYRDKSGGLCGLILAEGDEGEGRLTIFYDNRASRETRFQFETYVQTHLERRAALGSVRRIQLFSCDKCMTPVTGVQVQRRRDRGFDFLNCNVCGASVSLCESVPSAMLNSTPGIVQAIDRAVDSQKSRDTAETMLKGKMELGEFDVFICYNSQDRDAVTRIANALKRRGVLPWMDRWQLRPGIPWQRVLEEQIEKVKAAAVFVGPSGVGPWQSEEIDAFLRECVRRHCPVIPVLLENAVENRLPPLPVFLRGRTWVDFRVKQPNPLRNLLWGIEGSSAKKKG